eukprot:2817530-Lingulodinium_polyedra.AAC.1
MWHASLAGVPAFREHPDIPVWLGPSVATSWLLEEEIFLYQAAGNGIARFSQCLLGSQSKKPTALGYVNFAELELA